MRLAWGGLVRLEQALQNGADVNDGSLDVFGRTPLHLACRSGHLAVVHYLLTSRGANLEATDNDGRTPLHFACLRGHLDVVQELVARGANLEASTNSGKTPLHWACWNGHLDVVQELVARGADLFVTATNGKTVFDYAFDRGHNNVVDYLLHAYLENVSAREGLQAIHSILQAATFSYVAANPRQALSLQVQLPLSSVSEEQ